MYELEADRRELGDLDVFPALRQEAGCPGRADPSGTRSKVGPGTAFAHTGP